MVWVWGTVDAQCGVSGEQVSQLEEGGPAPSCVTALQIFTRPPREEGKEGGRLSFSPPPQLGAGSRGGASQILQSELLS